jgi:hypothetical protein
MALDTLINTITTTLGVPSFPKKGVNKFQYLDTRFRSTVSVSGPLVAESLSYQLGESMMCGTKFLEPNPFTLSQALPPHIIATPLSYLLGFGGLTSVVSTNCAGVNNFAGPITNLSGTTNLNGVVTLNGKNLEAEIALAKSLPSSDERLKNNIHTITNPIEKVSALRGVSFEYKETGQKQIGFIAQEIEKIIPEVVGENPDGYKGVQYQNVVGLLVEAIKEQQKQIDELKEKINE